MSEVTRLHLGDCVEVLKTLPDGSVDAVVTDPPYELGFMGKRWDASGIAYSVALWTEALRVLKPGGHLLAFGGTRTYHRMACAIEDAGFEIRDSLHWLYGSGFPKSLDVSKAIDKAAGAEREVLGVGAADCAWIRRGEACQGHGDSKQRQSGETIHAPFTAPATDAARQWSGWGTALKPAHEPVIVARKPLVGTVADNVQTHGTGALNIDGCRVGTESTIRKSNAGTNGDGWRMGKHSNVNGSDSGRWPPNILLSHTPECGESCAEDCPVAEMDRQSGASRFFPVFRYQAKASRSERETGLRAGQKASHPTVKPVALMRWLVRLVTPPRGVVLDPFTGSGTTGVACAHEGFRFIGIEREPEYHAIADARIKHALQAKEPQAALFAGEVA